MEPFRESSGTCPACGAAPLRAVGKRLVCDRCEGMLIGGAELAEALREVGDFTPAAVETANGEVTEIKCPRCTQPMQRGAIRVGPQILDRPTLWCATDGAWLSQDQMVVELARSSRRSSAATRHHGGVASAAADLAPSGGEMAALRGVGNAFTKNQRLPISYRPPRVRTAFVSAFAGRQLACPACPSHPALGFVGDRWTCQTCSGSFVEDAALVAMVSDIKGEPWELPALADNPGTRACPVCTSVMVTETLGTVTLDRCKGHGTWFDEAELGPVLLEASTPTEPPTGGLGGWLKRLFSR